MGGRQLDILEECLSPADVRKSLSTLPHTLDETYAQILRRIRPEYKSHAVRLLQLLTYSERPLLIEEAVDAIAVEPAGKPRFNFANRMPIPEEIARYCSGLVPLTKKYDGFRGHQVLQIQLAHFSVQEYLLSNRLEPKLQKHFDKIAAAAAIVDICLSYLLAIDPLLPIKQAKEEHPFAEFSARSWFDHAAIVESASEKVIDIVKEYYTCRATFAQGYSLFPPKKETEGLIRRRTQRNEVPSPLYFASLVGLGGSVHLLLQAGANPNTNCGYLGNALQAASLAGHGPIVRILVQHGADVNAQGGQYGNALQAASYQGHEAIVGLLIDKGAYVNAQGGRNGNALQAASFRGHEAIVSLLVDKNADVNGQGGKYGNALQAASHQGHKSIVRLLIDNGAKVNAQGGGHGYAIVAASYEGHEVIVGMLIQHGADVNAQDGDYGTALQVASSRGHYTIVEMLLENRADAEA